MPLELNSSPEFPMLYFPNRSNYPHEVGQVCPFKPDKNWYNKQQGEIIGIAECEKSAYVVRQGEFFPYTFEPGTDLKIELQRVHQLHRVLDGRSQSSPRYELCSPFKVTFGAGRQKIEYSGVRGAAENSRGTGAVFFVEAGVRPGEFLGNRWARLATSPFEVTARLGVAGAGGNYRELMADLYLKANVGAKWIAQLITGSKPDWSTDVILYAGVELVGGRVLHMDVPVFYAGGGSSHTNVDKAFPIKPANGFVAGGEVALGRGGWRFGVDYSRAGATGLGENFVNTHLSARF